MRLPRYSMRTFFVAITACACLIAWAVSNLRQMKDARAIIEQRGGIVTRIGHGEIIPDSLPALFQHSEVEVNYHGQLDEPLLDAILATRYPTSVNLSGADCTDAQLLRLCESQTITSFNLSGARITDRAVRRLANNTAIQYLNLDDTAISDYSIEHLSRLTKLETLSLNSTACCGTTLGHLRAAPLEELRLAFTPTNDSAIPELSQLRHLKSLYLTSTEVSASGLSKLESLGNLEYLNVDGIDLHRKTDCLARANSLRIADLRSTKIDDEDLRLLLKQCPRLHGINIIDTSVSLKLKKQLIQAGLNVTGPEVPKPEECFLRDAQFESP